MRQGALFNGSHATRRRAMLATIYATKLCISCTVCDWKLCSSCNDRNSKNNESTYNSWFLTS